MPLETVPSLTQVLAVLANFGLGGMVFVIWYWGLKRQTGLETIIENYEHRSHESVAAFKRINDHSMETFKEMFEAYRRLNDETHRTILLSIQVQTRLVEKLERMEAKHGQR